MCYHQNIAFYHQIITKIVVFAIAIIRKIGYNNTNEFGKGLIKMNFEVTKDTIIGDILDMDFDVAPYFIEMGMHCLGCPASRGETVEQACEVHGVDANELVKKLNAHFSGK